MKGGFNVGYLVSLLSDKELAADAEDALEQTLLIYNAFDDVATLATNGNKNAQSLIQNGLMQLGLLKKLNIQRKLL